MQYAKPVLVFVITLLVGACSNPAERAARYLADAQKYYDAGDYVSSRVQAKNAVQTDPKNAQARYLLALVAERNGNIREMYTHLMVAVSSKPDYVDARLKLGMLYFVGQAFTDAAEEAEILRKLAPEDPRARLLYARVLIQRGERPAGLVEVKKALETDPNNVDGILLHAAVEATENLDQGLAILDTAIAQLEREKSRLALSRRVRGEEQIAGRTALDSAIARLVETDKSRQLRELRVMLLAEGKRLPELEEGLLGLIKEFPEKREYQYELAQFYTEAGRVDEADALLRSLALGEKAKLDDRLIYVQFLAAERDPARAEEILQGFIKDNPQDTMLHLALAQLYLDTQRPEDARAVYRIIARRDPKSPEGLAARNRLAALEIRVERMAEAMAVIEGILADAPDDATALLLRAGARFAEKKFATAIEDLRLVLNKDSANERALLLMALAHLQANERTLAKDAYRHLLDANPNSVEGTMQLAALYAGEGNFADAEILLRRRVAVAPDDLLASGRLVEMLIAQGKTAPAEQEARRMTALQGQSGVGEFSLGRVLASRGDFSGAAEAYRRSTTIRKDDPVALESLVESLEKSGNSQEAITVLSAELNNQRNELLARFLLGGIYSRRGERARAQEYYESVIREKPALQYPYISLAAAYPDDAAARIGILERGLAAIPADPALSMLLGAEYDREGQYDQAIRIYETLVAKHPQFEPGINNLAAMLLDHRATDKQALARALKLVEHLEFSASPLVLDTVGWAYYRNGDYKRAIRLLEQVVATSGEYGQFRYHLAMAYLAAGNQASAKQQLQAALIREGDFPNREDAEVALARLQQQQGA